MATIVKKKPGESDEALIAEFRKKILFDDVINEIKERQNYEKPSQRRYQKEKYFTKGRKKKKREK